MSCLNSFHNSVQFTYEIEKENEISFLDILIICSGQKIETRVYRAYMINTNDSYFKSKLKYLQKVFHERNGYPPWFIMKVMNEVKRLNIPKEHFERINENENEVTYKQTLILPYAGEKGCSIVRYLEKQLKRSLPNYVKPNIVFTSTKLSCNFNLEDPLLFIKKHDVIYRIVCVTENCNEDHVGECARRLYEHVKDHNGCNHSSHLVKHAAETGHLPVDTANFEVIRSRYHNNACHRKIAEALPVKKLKPTLNIQEKSVLLKLFN